MESLQTSQGLVDAVVIDSVSLLRRRPRLGRLTSIDSLDIREVVEIWSDAEKGVKKGRSDNQLANPEFGLKSLCMRE